MDYSADEALAESRERNRHEFTVSSAYKMLALRMRQEGLNGDAEAFEELADNVQLRKMVIEFVNRRRSKGDTRSRDREQATNDR